MKFSTSVIAGLFPIAGAIFFAIIFLTGFGGIAHENFTHVSTLVEFISLALLGVAAFGGYKLTQELPGETIKWVSVAYGALLISISIVYLFAPSVIV